MKVKEFKETFVEGAVPCPYCGGRLKMLADRPVALGLVDFQTHGGKKSYNTCCYDAARLTLFTQPHRPNMPKCFPTTEKLVKHWNKLLVKAAMRLALFCNETILGARYIKYNHVSSQKPHKK